VKGRSGEIKHADFCVDTYESQLKNVCVNTATILDMKSLRWQYAYIHTQDLSHRVHYYNARLHVLDTPSVGDGVWLAKQVGDGRI
jgi:hypothetical protein